MVRVPFEYLFLCLTTTCPSGVLCALMNISGYTRTNTIASLDSPSPVSPRIPASEPIHPLLPFWMRLRVHRLLALRMYQDLSPSKLVQVEPKPDVVRERSTSVGKALKTG
ncbi:hypothetical protein BKA90DRAFT_136054 [Yarrowia lipolytica]|nr:hypothetical protein BKA90DRAFT_136054 [Yarrowia lipolytica]